MTEIERAKESDIAKGYVDLLIAITRQAHLDSLDKQHDKARMQDARAFIDFAKTELAPYLVRDDVPYRQGRVGRRLIL